MLSKAVRRYRSLSPEQKRRVLDRCAAYKKRYRKTKRYKEVHRNEIVRYYRKYPEKYKYGVLRRSSQQRGMPFVITKKEFYDWYLRQERKCAYCDLIDLSYGGELSWTGQKAASFTIDRKNSSLPYTVDNMCFACWFCNRLKSDFFSYDEWREIAQKYIKPKWVAKMQAAAA